MIIRVLQFLLSWLLILVVLCLLWYVCISIASVLL